ncbi:MAG: P1 family peptidase, partial [Chloroflexi bacterium]|nr:P1 family peptidase [Chloroflexota bacterium]
MLLLEHRQDALFGNAGQLVEGAVDQALGDVHARDGRPLAVAGAPAVTPPPVGNTTLVVIATDAALDRAQCRRLAEAGHVGLARGIRPVHTKFDGDVVFALSTGDGSRATAELLFAVSEAAIDAIGEAIERSVAG